MADPQKLGSHNSRQTTLMTDIETSTIDLEHTIVFVTSFYAVGEWLTNARSGFKRAAER